MGGGGCTPPSGRAFPPILGDTKGYFNSLAGVVATPYAILVKLVETKTTLVASNVTLNASNAKLTKALTSLTKIKGCGGGGGDGGGKGRGEEKLHQLQA